MKRILVVGDIMLDKHLHGECSRISPEAPIPVIDLPSNGVGISLGAAANVAAHIINANIECVLAYKSYTDPPGENSHDYFKSLCLERGIICRPLYFGDSIQHTVTIKERIWAGNQQICRVDREDRSRPDKVVEFQWIKELENAIINFDIGCVIFSDYDKGTLTDPIIQNIANICQMKNIPTILDPKRPSYSKIRKLTLVKPNSREVAITNMDPYCLSDILGETYLVHTLGKDGMSVYRYGEKEFDFPTLAKPEDVIDVCGAGDTVSAIFGIMLYRHKTMEEVVSAGSEGAAISIKHRGCYVPNREEMKNILQNYTL